VPRPDATHRRWRREVDGLSDAELLERWKADYETLAADVRTIHRRRIIFNELDDEMVCRAAKESGYVVERFLRPMYGDAQAVTLRRLNDDDPRTVSFRRLVEEVRLRPSVLSRAHYIETALARLIDPDDDDRRIANLMFDHIAGAGCDEVPDSVLDGYLTQLGEDFARVQEFVDTNVAHRDRVSGAGLTWHELDTAIDHLEGRMNDIGHLLTGVHDAAAPSLPPLWRDAFRHLFER
jgi:hypothetical protein